MLGIPGTRIIQPFSNSSLPVLLNTALVCTTLSLEHLTTANNGSTDSLSSDLHRRDKYEVPRETELGTLTGVLGQPGSDADLQHFVAGLEDGQVTETLVELHLPGAPCTPGTPVLLFQLQFKAVTSTLIEITNQKELVRKQCSQTKGCWQGDNHGMGSTPNHIAFK